MPEKMPEKIPGKINKSFSLLNIELPEVIDSSNVNDIINQIEKTWVSARNVIWYLLIIASNQKWVINKKDLEINLLKQENRRLENEIVETLDRLKQIWYKAESENDFISELWNIDLNNYNLRKKKELLRLAKKREEKFLKEKKEKSIKESYIINNIISLSKYYNYLIDKWYNNHAKSIDKAIKTINWLKDLDKKYALFKKIEKKIENMKVETWEEKENLLGKITWLFN